MEPKSVANSSSLSIPNNTDQYAGRQTFAPDKPRSFDCNTNIYRSGSLIDIDSREEHRVSGNSGNYHHFSSFRYYMEHSDVDKLDGIRDGIFAEVRTPNFSAHFYLMTPGQWDLPG